MKIESPFWIFLEFNENVAGCHIAIEPGPNRIDKILHSLFLRGNHSRHTTRSLLSSSLYYSHTTTKAFASSLLLHVQYRLAIQTTIRLVSMYCGGRGRQKERKNNELRIYKMCLCSIPKKYLKNCTRSSRNE